MKIGFYFSHKTVLLMLIKINYKNVIRKSTQSKNQELKLFFKFLFNSLLQETTEEKFETTTERHIKNTFPLSLFLRLTT